MNKLAILKSLKKSYLAKEKFYNSFTNRKISDKEYEHVLNAWKKIEIKTMKDYHDLYLKCGVFLLADDRNNFRKIEKI